MKAKSLQKGIDQLVEEGATQVFRPLGSNEIIIGAVGALQFDVVAYRLENEYGVDAVFEPTSTVTARWLRGDENEIKQLISSQGHSIGLDVAGEHVYLAPSSVSLMIMQERFKNVQFMKTREVVRVSQTSEG